MKDVGKNDVFWSLVHFPPRTQYQPFFLDTPFVPQGRATQRISVHALSDDLQNSQLVRENRTLTRAG